MTDREVLTIIFYKEVGKLLSNEGSCPQSIYSAAEDLIFNNGFKHRQDYVDLVYYLISDQEDRDILVNEVK